MKWLPPAGSTQRSTDGRYMVMRANPQHWIAYYLGRSTSTYIELDVLHTDHQARERCEQHATASSRRV